MAHVHRAAQQSEKPFTGPVRQFYQNPKAHGWMTLHQTCACGATRRINRNGTHTERGIWIEA